MNGRRTKYLRMAITLSALKIMTPEMREEKIKTGIAIPPRLFRAVKRAYNRKLIGLDLKPIHDNNNKETIKRQRRS